MTTEERIKEKMRRFETFLSKGKSALLLAESHFHAASLGDHRKWEDVVDTLRDAKHELQDAEFDAIIVRDFAPTLWPNDQGQPRAKRA